MLSMICGVGPSCWVWICDVNVVDGLGRREDGPTMKGEGGVFVKKDFIFGVYKTR